MSYWLMHGRFTQSLSFARDLCLAAGVEIKKKGKERMSTETYLLFGFVGNVFPSFNTLKPSLPLRFVVLARAK